MTTRFHVIVKPLGALCNLDCTYCYYLSKPALGLSHNTQMSEEVLETFIRQYIAGQDSEEVHFSWQGGEPTLLGLDFFRHVLELERKYQKPNQRIANDIQTNGVLLDDQWCAFLKEHDFLVGLSIDGPEDVHDRYRRSKGGEGTFRQVFAAAQRLRKHGVLFNTLSVVHRDNALRPAEVYRFLTREVGSTRLQFLPCVEPKSFETTAPRYWSPADCPTVGTSAARPGRRTRL